MPKSLRRMVMVAVLLLLTTVVSAASVYDPDLAIAYAQKYWNTDAQKLCAEFVSDCLNAGNNPVFDVSCTRLVAKLKVGNYGEEYAIQLGDSRKVPYAPHAANLSPGDPLFEYCTYCAVADGKPYIHVYLFAKSDPSGYLWGYAHNYALEGTIQVSRKCYKCNTPLTELRAFHMNQPLPGDVNADGKVSVADCVALSRYLTGTYNQTYIIPLRMSMVTALSPMPTFPSLPNTLPADTTSSYNNLRRGEHCFPPPAGALPSP